MQTQAELLIYVVDRLHGTNGHPRHGFIRVTKAAYVVGVDPQRSSLQGDTMPPCYIGLFTIPTHSPHASTAMPTNPHAMPTKGRPTMPNRYPYPCPSLALYPC